MSPSNQRALLMSVFGGMQHERPVESTCAVLAQSSGAHWPDDGLQILENEMRQQPVAELFADFYEVLFIGNGRQLTCEVLDILKIAVAGPDRSSVAAFQQQQTADAESLALHLVPYSSQVREVHVRVTGIPALRFEVRVLA